ncbi:hypothetical protein EPO05_05355 [Patescibacteria group bacterium]|nr:MAG: hypothetical protein EPO05_05355 [Patescibacteria group bacterium]
MTENPTGASNGPEKAPHPGETPPPPPEAATVEHAAANKVKAAEETIRKSYEELKKSIQEDKLLTDAKRAEYLKKLETSHSNTLTQLEKDMTNFRDQIIFHEAVPNSEHWEKALKALDDALQVIKKIPETEKTENQKRIVKSVEDARAQAEEDGQFEVRFGHNKEFSQKEGIPVDELLGELKKKQDKLEQDLQTFNTQDGAEITDLKEQLKQIDEEEAVDALDPAEIKILEEERAKLESQLKQVTAKQTDLESEIKDLSDLRQTLTENSQGYFELRPDMVNEKQHPRTELEAYFISQDNRKTGTQESDYTPLAMEAMRDRRELVKKQSEEGEIELVVEPPKPPVTEGYHIDISEIVKAFAWRQAEEKLRECLDKSNFFKKCFVRLGEKGYLMKFYKEALNAIQANKNLMSEIETRVLGDSTVRSEHKDRSYELLDSVIEEYTKNIAEATEKGETVNDPAVNSELSRLFAEHALNPMTREQFDAEVTSRINPLLNGKQYSTDAGRDREAKGLMYANNFFKLAEAYREQASQKVAELEKQFGPEQRENILKELRSEMALDIHLGLKERDIYETKPKPVLKWYEKFVDITQNIPVLNKIIASPTAYGVLGGVVGSLFSKGSTRALTGIGIASLGVAPWLTPLILGAAFGGTYGAMRRSRDLQYDRGMDLRRKTLGYEVGPDATRTQKIREFHYDLKQADELQAGLETLKNQTELSDEDKRAVAEVIARIQTEREKSVDLIGVSEEKGQEHRTKLIAMKDLKVSLSEVRAQFGLTEAELAPLVQEWNQLLAQNIQENDQLFGKYKRTESIKAGFIGAGVGLVAGALAQYGSNKIQEMFGHTPKSESALEHLWHKINGNPNFERDLVPAAAILPDGSPIKVSVPRGYTVLQGVDGKNVLFDAQGRSVGPVNFAEDGSLLETSKNMLAERGVRIDTKMVEGGTRTVGAMDYLKDKLGVHKRGLWHDEPGERYSNFFNRFIEHEGKQQMLHLKPEADGRVYVDVSKIIDNIERNLRGDFKVLGTNPDGSIDNDFMHMASDMKNMEPGALRDMIRERLQFAVIPTGEANRQGLSLLVEGATPDGKIYLPEELAQQFKSAADFRDGHLPFSFGETRFAGDVLNTGQGVELGDFTVTDQPISTHEIFVPKSWDVPYVLPAVPRWQLEGRRTKEQATKAKEAEEMTPVNMGGVNVNVPNENIEAVERGEDLSAEAEKAAEESIAQPEKKPEQSPVTPEVAPEKKEERQTLKEIFEKYGHLERPSAKDREEMKQWLMPINQKQLAEIFKSEEQIKQLAILYKKAFPNQSEARASFESKVRPARVKRLRLILEAEEKQPQRSEQPPEQNVTA